MKCQCCSISQKWSLFSQVKCKCCSVKAKVKSFQSSGEKVCKFSKGARTVVRHQSSWRKQLVLRTFQNSFCITWLPVVLPQDYVIFSQLWKLHDEAVLESSIAWTQNEELPFYVLRLNSPEVFPTSTIISNHDSREVGNHIIYEENKLSPMFLFQILLLT